MKTRHTSSRVGQSGVMLLEALIAILIFSLGVLALVGLQSVSIKQSSESKYRADAVMLANELIADMWIGDRSFANISAQYTTGGPAYNAWAARVQRALPGVVANPPDVPAPIAVGNPADPSTMVTVRVNWKAPNEPAADPAHFITVVAQIK